MSLHTCPTALAEPWRLLWNGDLDQSAAIIADDFVAHVAPMGSGVDSIRGAAALNAWVSGLHQSFSGLTFTIEVGPIASDDHLVVRWRTRGTYQGGFPGVSDSAAGRNASFTGIDILRVVDGRIAEYWVDADMMGLMQQLTSPA